MKNKTTLRKNTNIQNQLGSIKKQYTRSNTNNPSNRMRSKNSSKRIKLSKQNDPAQNSSKRIKLSKQNDPAQNKTEPLSYALRPHNNQPHAFM